MIDNDHPAETFEKEGETHCDEQPRDRIPRLMRGDDRPEDGEEHRYHAEHDWPPRTLRVEACCGFRLLINDEEEDGQQQGQQHDDGRQSPRKETFESVPVHGFSTHRDVHKLRDGYDPDLAFIRASCLSPGPATLVPSRVRPTEQSDPSMR